MATTLKRGLPPVHPGEILKEMFLEERDITITDLAKSIGVDRSNLSGVINGKHAVSPELAVKLSAAFGNAAQFWLNMQQAFDLFAAERKVNRAKIRTYVIRKTVKEHLIKRDSQVVRGKNEHVILRDTSSKKLSLSSQPKAMASSKDRNSPVKK